MLKENLKQFQDQIKEYKDVVTVITTKYTDENGIRELYNLGVRDFGENRVEDFLQKYEALADLKDINWHFVGHIQSKKVKDIVDKVQYIHSIDSLKLAQEINLLAKRKIKCFLEIHNGIDDTKYGFSVSEINELLSELPKLENIEVIGLMVMGPLTTDNLVLRSLFNKVKYLQEDIKKIMPSCSELSMGMSNDYLIALDCGASFLRVGRIIFKGGF